MPSPFNASSMSLTTRPPFGYLKACGSCFNSLGMILLALSLTTGSLPDDFLVFNPSMPFFPYLPLRLNTASMHACSACAYTFLTVIPPRLVSTARALACSSLFFVPCRRCWSSLTCLCVNTNLICCICRCDQGRYPSNNVDHIA